MIIGFFCGDLCLDLLRNYIANCYDSIEFLLDFIGICLDHPQVGGAMCLDFVGIWMELRWDCCKMDSEWDFFWIWMLFQSFSTD